MKTVAYTPGMPNRARPPVPPNRPRKPRETRSERRRTNRIYELTQARKWTYADVAERVRIHAEARGDKAHVKVHEVTINRLALGTQTLTQEWMEILGEVYSVPAHEIISAPIAHNLRRVRVTFALQAGKWSVTNELEEKEQFDVMVPDDTELRDSKLYGGEVVGPSMNLRYADRSIAIISKITQHPGEIAEGRRYHVRATRPDGTVEDSIKMLVKGPEGKFWLKPESNHPDHQMWIPLDGTDTLRVEIVGRVRGVYFREE